VTLPMLRFPRSLERLLKAVEDQLGEIDLLPLDVPADAEYGGIPSGLEAAGKPIGGNDLLIAALAYAICATIVTAISTSSNASAA